MYRDHNKYQDDESGLGSLEGPDFFNSYVNNLEMAVREMGGNGDDPTIDLQQLDLALRPPSPIRKPTHGSNATNKDTTVGPRTDPGLEELEFLANEIKKKSYYGEKLVTIMMKNLEKTLGPETYQIFLQGRLPKTWLPMIRMNNENCPYVEYLIKSDVADEDPESQLSHYTNNHLAYSQFILNHIHSTAQNKTMITPRKRLMETSTPLKSGNPKRQIQPPPQKQPARPPQQQPMRSLLLQPQTLPKQHQPRPQQVQKSQQDLNSSLKRRQPNRSCKLNSRYSDQSMSK